jgi:hypothetical protein
MRCDVSTTTQPPAEPAFHSDDVEHVADYQSLSVLALFSLLIGLTSPLSLFGKGFLLLPLSGIALSLIAMRRIAASEGRLAGRWAASIGLVLCVLAGAGAVARNSVARHMRTNQAENFARAWLMRITSDQLEQAFKLTYDGARPLAPREPGMPPPEKTPFEIFISDPCIQKITAAGKDAAVELVDTLHYTPQTRRVVSVQQRFRIIPTGDPAKSASNDPIEVDLTLLRSHFRAERMHWLVSRFQLADTNPPPQ